MINQFIKQTIGKVSAGTKLNKIELVAWNAFRITINNHLDSPFCDTVAIVDGDDVADAACCRLRVLRTPYAFCALTDVLQKNGIDETPVAPGRSIGKQARNNWLSTLSVRLADVRCIGNSSGVCARYVRIST